MVLPDGLNQRRSPDFVSDTLTCSRRFRMLCVVDDYTRDRRSRRDLRQNAKAHPGFAAVP